MRAWNDKCTHAIQAAACDLAQLETLGKSSRQLLLAHGNCGGNTFRLCECAQPFLAQLLATSTFQEQELLQDSTPLFWLSLRRPRVTRTRSCSFLHRSIWLPTAATCSSYCLTCACNSEVLRRSVWHCSSSCLIRSSLSDACRFCKAAKTVFQYCTPLQAVAMSCEPASNHHCNEAASQQARGVTHILLSQQPRSLLLFNKLVCKTRSDHSAWVKVQCVVQP